MSQLLAIHVAESQSGGAISSRAFDDRIEIV